MKLTVFECLFNPVRNTFGRLRKQAAGQVPLRENLGAEKSVPSSTSNDESANVGLIEETQVQNIEPLLQREVQDAKPIEQTQLQHAGPGPQTQAQDTEPIKQKETQDTQLIERTQVQNLVPIQAPLIKEPPFAPKILTNTLAPLPVQEYDGNRLSPGLSPVQSPYLRRNASYRSIGSKNSTDGNLLSAQLRRARIPYHRHAHNYLIPICKQKSIITVESIKQDILEGDGNIGPAEIEDVAAKVCSIAPKVFATLAYMKKGHEICGLLRDGLSDKDLPLSGKKNDHGYFTLERVSRLPIQTFERWDDDEKEEFDRIQWWMMAPVFKSNLHHELDENAILPFIPFEGNEETEKKKEGGYSEVYARRIHPSHHDFWDSEDCEALVAIKRLYSSDKIEFEKEVAILKALGSRRPKHPHLITLLATFKHHNKYHLIFPWADANLRKFWKDRPLPNFNEATFLWSLKQMTGIAHALDSIHNITTAYPPCVDCHNSVGQKEARSSDQRKKTLYGRHGDIKPENILWFSRIKEIGDEMGVLQIADFGLGGFHGRDSRSKIDPRNVVSSPTYEPPECQLQKPVSRAYDIWSLGCLYLEFITWLLMGAAKIEEFSNEHFFTITPDGNDAVVREGVVDWVQKLHGHERCSALIHNLLELIMKRVLIPDSQERMPAAELYKELNGLLRKAREDKVYLLKSVPWRQKSGRYRLRSAMTFIGIDAQKTKTNRKMDIESFNRNEFGSFPVAPSIPRDLVGRGAGTPGQIKRAQTLCALPSLGKANG